jgi:squalene-hopene/tetraprenyl-beta-curcumene cyclase
LIVKKRHLALLAVCLLHGSAGRGHAGEPRKTAPASADEPLAKTWSRDKSAAYLDGASDAWRTRTRCAACHTSYLYLMAGPSLRDRPSPSQRKMRQFLEDRVSRWDSGKKGDGPGEMLPHPPGQMRLTEGVTEVVATASALAFHDAETTGKLHPLTRQALDRVWTLQRPDGAWAWNKTGLAPLEYDDYYGATFAALGVGQAPDGFALTAKAKAGLAKLRTYFAKNPPPNLHHRVWLLWASVKLDDLMSAADRAQTVKELLALQREDGGWNLPSLGAWKRRNGAANDKEAPSDGYATGLAVYVLRQTGLPADDAQIRRGVGWLKTHQRESGRWFTRSVNNDREHLISNAGTALCAMALKACGATK